MTLYYCVLLIIIYTVQLNCKLPWEGAVGPCNMGKVLILITIPCQYFFLFFRISWILMSFWILKIWRSPTRLLWRPPPAKKLERGRPVRTGECSNTWMSLSKVRFNVDHLFVLQIYQRPGSLLVPKSKWHDQKAELHTTFYYGVNQYSSVKHIEGTLMVF